jgi:hypothetical protein
MNGLGHRAGRAPDFGKKVLFPITGVFLTDAAHVGAEVPRSAGKKLGIRLASDDFDIRDYSTSARWVIEGGRLYRELSSKYPLFANIVFASFHYLGKGLCTSDRSILREVYAQEWRNALFILPSAQLAVTLPVDARIIVMDLNYEQTAIVGRYAGPNNISDTGKGHALLSALRDYVPKGSERKTFANMSVFLQ